MNQRHPVPCALALLLLLPGCGDPRALSSAPSAPPRVPAALAAAEASAAVPEGDKRPHPKPKAREGAPLTRSPVEPALYLADEDHSVVRRIPLPVDVQRRAVSVAMPGRPAAVLALADKILVTIRDPGLLLVLRAGSEPREIARVAVPDDAWGLAVSPDEKTAIVTSAWSHQVSAIDLEAAKLRWSVDVPREPRAVVVKDDGAAVYVTHLVGAALTRIDELDHDKPRVSSLAFPPDPLRTRHRETISASLAYAAALSPDGSRLYVARHALGAVGGDAWFGTSTIDVLSTRSDTPIAPTRGAPAFGDVTSDLLGSMPVNADAAGLIPETWRNNLVQPRAIAYRARTDTLLVASEGSDAVVEFDARSIAPALQAHRTYAVAGNVPEKETNIQIPASCGAPSGIALSDDDLTAWVYCRSTDDLAIVSLDPYDEGARFAPGPIPWIHLADASVSPEVSPEVSLGRRLFYNGTEPVVSGGLGCAGCHPEGRDDGHVWHEMKKGPYASGPIFVSGTSIFGSGEGIFTEDDPRNGYARQTPMLAGRVKAVGPYGWHAESPDLVARLKAGFTLHRWWKHDADGKSMRNRAEPLIAFLREGLAPPPRRARELTPEEARGKELFNADKTRCATCHVPQSEFTDRSAAPLRQLKVKGYDEDPNHAFKVPSLLYVGGTPPYFHDGAAATLEELIEKNNDRMGKTSRLSTEEKAALVAFLRTL
jgi:DNA-binding beta-propeller fold protein YncE